MELSNENLSSLRILVAEDNLINQKVIKLILGKMGFEPKIVNNGMEVVAEFDRNPYDVILMDDNMPEMDGITAASEIRKHRINDASPYIVAMTANSVPGDRERYLSLGMDDYISKPIRNEDLGNLLRRVSVRKA